MTDAVRAACLRTWPCTLIVLICEVSQYDWQAPVKMINPRSAHNASANPDNVSVCFW